MSRLANPYVWIVGLFLAVLSFPIIEGGLFIRESRRTLIPVASQTFVKLGVAADKLGAASDQLGVASTQIGNVSVQLQGYDHGIKNIIGSFSAMGLAGAQVEADERNAFPAQNVLLSKTLTDADAGLTTLNTEVGNFQPVIDNLRGSSQALDAQLSNPAISDTLHHADAAVTNLDGVTADGKVVADHYEKVILAPVSKAKQVLGFFVWLAGRFY